MTFAGKILIDGIFFGTTKYNIVPDYSLFMSLEPSPNKYTLSPAD
jgi:hypothetical protein